MSRQPFLGILLAILVGTAASARPVDATSIAVTTSADELNSDGDCSLREAVQAANSNTARDACPAGQSDQVDTIVVAAGTYTLTLAGNDDTNAGGDLDLLDDVTITGAGAATTIIQACDVEQQAATCPAGHGVVDRVFHVLDSDAAISGVTVRRGRVGASPGHGIFVHKLFANETAALTLTDSVVTKNGTTSTDFALTRGGGIGVQNAALTATRVTVSDNAIRSGGGSGGGIGNDGAEATLVMTDCTVSGNQAGNHGGGIYNNNASAIITASTINANHAFAGNGGGLSSNSGTATLTNCTVSGNQSGGSFGGGIFANGGSVNIRSCTITLNRLGNGQGAGGLDAGGTNSTVLRNTIIAGNLHDNSTPSQHDPDCEDGSAPAIVDEGHNFVGDGFRCATLVDGQNGNQVGTRGNALDAKLDPLADNGGPTPTHALQLDSLAVDAADPAVPGSGGTACPTTDQRGEPRPAGVACDIGAVELATGGALDLESVQPARGGNAGTVQLRVYGTGIVDGATVKLVRDGLPDVVGSATAVRGPLVATSLDLRGVAPGVWSVAVENPDASTATLADAFTVENGGAPDVWSDLLMPTRFISGRFQSLYLQFGNRGTVDAHGVPIWISFPDELEFHVPFAVSVPPAQPGQLATDWTRIAIDAPIPAPENRDSFPLLLPVVPAGSTGVIKIRVESPVGADASRLPFVVTADVGTPYFQPDLSGAVVAAYVERAKEYAETAHETTVFPSDAAIEAYVRTQLTEVVAQGTSAAVANPGGSPPVYSQAQLLIDTGQFIAGESATASALALDRSWLARLTAKLLTRSAEARVIDPDCDPADAYCERNDPCDADPKLCNTDPPIIRCDRLNRINDEFVFVPCKPKDEEPRDLTSSADPNDKVGPGGPGGYIDGVTPLPYVIFFENVPTASSDAFEVTVTDQLDVAKYDLDTFSLGSISFGSTFVPVPPGLQSFSTEVDLRPGVNILVGIDAALDTATGIVTWKFTTLDPVTHEFPEDPEDGFLPPNVTSPEGEGAVLFTVSLKPGFGLGTTVCNDARIVFDFNPHIDTPEFCNTIGEPEDCENCIDDDGDQLVDRADDDCAPPADGAGDGIDDPEAAKAVDKCAKAIRKAGAKLASVLLKQLGACEKAVADCVQLKPGDTTCLTKAETKCTKARAALPVAEGKLTTTIDKACGEPKVAAANLVAAVGLGFSGEAGACAERGVESIATVADVADCAQRQQRCAAERVLGAVMPRAREMLVLGGFDPLTDLGCIGNGANGGGSAISGGKNKPIRKCDATIQKATLKLLAGREKAGHACGAAVFTCVQSKPDDASCLEKAGDKCTKAVAALPKLAADFATNVGNACGATPATPLTPLDLLAVEGLGMSAIVETCARLGVESLVSVGDITTCLERQIACRTDQLLENQTPRLDELLDLGGVALP